LAQQLKAAPLVQVFAHQQEVGPESVHQFQARRPGGCRPQQQLRTRQGTCQQPNQQAAGQTTNPTALSQHWQNLRRQPRATEGWGRLLHADQGGAQYSWGRSGLTASFDTWIRTSRRLNDFPESDPGLSDCLPAWVPMAFFDSDIVQEEARRLFSDYQQLMQLGSDYGKFDREGKKLFIVRMEEMMDRYRVFMKRFELSEDFQAKLTVEQLRTQLGQFGLTPDSMFQQLNQTLERMKSELGSAG
jgi:hypothetical protein